MNLSSSQNKLLRAEVSFTMIMTWVQIGVLVFGIFGMNLHSGLEWNESGPWSPKTHTHKGPTWNFLNVGCPSPQFSAACVPSPAKRTQACPTTGCVATGALGLAAEAPNARYLLCNMLRSSPYISKSQVTHLPPTAECCAGGNHHNRWHGRRMPVDVALSPQDGHPHPINEPLLLLFATRGLRRISSGR